MQIPAEEVPSLHRVAPKFTIAANRKLNVISESQVVYGPATNGDGCVVGMECFLHDLLQEQVQQDE